MRLLITGANGFIASNLRQYFSLKKNIQVYCFSRSDNIGLLSELLDKVDFVFHLAGVNRSDDPAEFVLSNVDLTKNLCQLIAKIAKNTNRKIGIVYTSTTQVNNNSAYGLSKKHCEDIILSLHRDYDIPIHIFRLPNVFGKWCRPSYNSVVATFCHNIANGLPIIVNDPTTIITLVHIDDIVNCFAKIIETVKKVNYNHLENVISKENNFKFVNKQYTISLKKLAHLIQFFNDNRKTFMIEYVGNGLIRALYDTYISYLPTSSFTYDLLEHINSDDTFAEFSKTSNCRQLSYFSVPPRATRVIHDYLSKTQKFLVIHGRAHFEFVNVQTNELYQCETSSDKPQVVETIPGWAQKITNIGADNMIVLLWANKALIISNAGINNSVCSKTN